MANYMREIAKLLGLELGEIFQVDNDDLLKNYCFRFTKIGLEFSESKNDNIWITSDSYTVFSLLRGELSVIKLPWKPKNDEEYYIPNISNAIGYNRFYWKGDNLDDRYYNLGLVVKSKEDAIALRKKMLAVAKGDKDNG